MDNELYHYGVKGMKWGVRKEYEPHPRKYKYNSEYSKEVKSKYKNKINRYVASGSTRKEAERKAYLSERKKTALKTLAVVGAATLAAGGIIVGSKTHRLRVDRIIKAGHKLQRISDTKEVDVGRAFYAAYKKGDIKKYEALYGNQIKSKDLFGLGKDNVYKASLLVNTDLKVASQKNAAKVLDDLYKTDDEFRRLVDFRVKAFGKPLNKHATAKDRYEAFNRGLYQHDEWNQIGNEKFYNAMKSKGYNAIEDINDLKYSGYRAKDPIIVFDNADGKVSVNNVVKMNNDDIDAKFKIERGKLIAEHMMRDPGNIGLAVGTGGIVAATTAGDNKMVNDYKLMHPDTKLTDKQIEKMLMGKK